MVLAMASTQNRIKPPALNALLAVDAWWRSQKASTASAIESLIGMIYAYQKPDEALQAMDRGEDAYWQAAKDYSATVPLDGLHAMAAEITRHVQALFPPAPEELGKQ